MTRGSILVALVFASAVQAGCGSGNGGSGGGGGSGSTGASGSTGTAGVTGAGGGQAGTVGAGGSGGQAGTVGAGGRGGQAGTVGASGSGGADCFPRCIADARIGCWRPTTGSCTRQPGGGSNKYCYSNGVTEVAGPLNKLHTFSNASGQTCFSFEDVSPSASTTTEVVFKDGAGNEVARGTHPFSTFVWTITCGGQTYTVDEADPSCRTLGLSDCTQGLCP